MFIVGVHCVQAEETVYTKREKTAPTSLATGDVVVIVDLTNAVAMSNDKGTNKAPGAESVTLNDEQTRITDEEVKDIVQWKVTVTGNGYKFAKLGSDTELLYGDDEWEIKTTESMFLGSPGLVGAVPYNPSKVDGAMANPVTGYFTYKGMPGDANNDGKVDVNDVTTVINYILSKNPSPFIYDNANVNGDDSINVMDVTLIINIILGIH